MDMNDSIEVIKALERENAHLRAEKEREMNKAYKFNRAILKSAPFGLTIFDENINIIDCNDEILRICSTSKQYYIDHFFEFSPKYQKDGQNSIEKAADYMKRAMSGETLVFEWLHQSQYGDIIPCELTVTCIEDNGNFTGLAFAYDLRNIIKIKEEMSRAARINQSILETMPIGIAIFDGTPKVTDCNDELIRMFNAPKQQIIDRFYDDFSPEYLEDGRLSIYESLKIMNRAISGEKVQIEWPHQTAAGEPVPCELTLTRVKDENEFIGLGFLYDLRNIKKMSANLQEQGELLKVRLEQQELISKITKSFVASGESDILINNAIDKIRRYLNASSIVIFGIDYELDKCFLAYNNCAEGEDYPLMKLSETHALIKEIFPLTLPKDTITPVLTCSDIANDPVLKTLNTVGICAIVGAPLYVDGRLWGLFSVEYRNELHEWKEIEVSFITTIASVIAGAIMRTIYDEKLKKALDHATAASEAKTVFLSNMSHEIRTPLNAIIGMTVIGKTAGDIQRKDYCFEKVENASQHLLGVINDVLDMSKIEANKFELSDEEYDFEKMLQRVINIIAFRADEKRQKLSVNIDKSIPRLIIGDDQRLAQVITNLLGNAVKFTPEEGSIKLETRFLGKEDDLYTIQITIKDSGIGISPEQQRQLFHSFHQAESGTSRRFGGTGLGLVISKNIIELMGGHIEVDSEIGKGSSFSFTFKARRAARNIPGLSEIGINWNNVSIMVVDDDKEILDYFREIIQGFGTSCDTASSGDEAIALIGANGMYNIFFVDWKMPGMDGIKLAKELKAKSESPEHTIIIMISAAEWSNVADEAKKAGVDKFLSKPLFPSAIADAITEAIGLTGQNNAKQSDNTDVFKGYRVLLAEDVDINREIVISLMESTHLEIDCAENGLVAVSMFDKSPDIYDLILMDVQMPEMDGYESTRKIRALSHPRAKTIPIVAMTANVFREDIEKCLNAGMNDHVGKPLNVDEFFSMLRRYLKEESKTT
ncbi:MAG: response regulator [Treponema sp.]|nr:response regulator [Treponema sp.]